MNDFHFDLYAMANPKTREDCALLVREVIAELANIRAHFDRVIAICEQQAAST